MSHIQQHNAARDKGQQIMKMAKFHFSKTEAIAEAKRVFGVNFKDKVMLKHNGALWVLSEV